MRATKTSLLPFLLALGILGFGGLAWYVANNPYSDLPREMKAPKPEVKRESEARIFTPKANGAEITLEERKVEVPKGEDPMVFSVNAFLQRAMVSPPEAKLLGVQVDEDGLATLSFNRAFERTYGTLDEKTLLDGIRASMGQFPNVKKILLTIEGQPLETLGGVDLTEPLDVLPEKSRDGA
jgi:hypothetical protein